MKVEWKSCFRIGVSFFVLFLAIYFWDGALSLLSRIVTAAAPVVAGFIVAYILNILMSFYERHYFTKLAQKKIVEKSRRPVCLVLAFVTLLGIVGLVVRLVIPELVSCVSFLLAEIPPAIEKILADESVAEILPSNLLSQLAEVDWKSSVSSIIQFVTSGIGSTVSTIYVAVTSVFSVIITFFISLIFAVYLLLGKEQLKNQGERLLCNYMRPAWASKLRYVMKVANSSFHRYIVGQCTEAVILGLLCMVGMLALQLPYAMMIGTLIGFSALIPVAGAYIGAGVGAIMILTVSPIKTLIFLVFVLVIQQIEGNLIYPKVVGNSIGLPGMWVLATITVAGSLWGITGMLVGVPIAATIYRLIREDVRKREAAKEVTVEMTEVSHEQNDVVTEEVTQE